MNIYRPFEDKIDKYYRLVDVTKGGFEYIHNELSYGRTLSKIINNIVIFESGRLETFAHRLIETSTLLQFKSGRIGHELPEEFRDFPDDGSKWGTPSPSISFFVAPIIQEFLAASKQNICIIEDIDSSPSGWLSPPTWMSKVPPFFTFDDKDVYFYIDDNNVTIATIRESFSIAATSWNMRAFLTSIPKDMKSLKINQEISIENLKKIAERTEKIIVSAYDGEGYLMWSKPASV